MGKMGDTIYPQQSTTTRRYATGYVRVSTEEQARVGVSLDAQRQRIEAHCAANGIELTGIHADEGISGRRASNRPGLDAALSEVQSRHGVLVVYSLSRLARSTKDAILIAERLSRARAELVLLSESVDTTTAAGRMFYAVLAALAAFESDLIGERTRMALGFKRSSGKRYCLNARYGFRFGEHDDLVENGDEQQVIRRMTDLSIEGHSLRSIAATLQRSDIRNRAGGWFTPAQVGVILRRVKGGGT